MQNQPSVQCLQFSYKASAFITKFMINIHHFGLFILHNSPFCNFSRRCFTISISNLFVFTQNNFDHLIIFVEGYWLYSNPTAKWAAYSSISFPVSFGNQLAWTRTLQAVPYSKYPKSIHGDVSMFSIITLTTMHKMGLKLLTCPFPTNCLEDPQTLKEFLDAIKQLHILSIKNY